MESVEILPLFHDEGLLSSGYVHTGLASSDAGELGPSPISEVTSYPEMSGQKLLAVCESPNIPVYLPIPMYGIGCIPRMPDFSQDLKFENVSTLHLLFF